MTAAGIGDREPLVRVALEAGGDTGGVFLGAGMLHMMPEADTQFRRFSATASLPSLVSW